MILYYLTLSADAILIIIQQRAALPVNDPLSTNLTLSSVLVDLDVGLCFLIEKIVKSLVISTDIFGSWFSFWIKTSVLCPGTSLKSPEERSNALVPTLLAQMCYYTCCYSDDT